jgi:Tfp pilus assembly protein PilZ
MLTSDPQSGKYGVTARLFSLISSLPRDQQLILLKQLVGEKVTEHLFKLIVEMSEDQQLILLEQMGFPADAEPQERTVSLEGTEPSMRETPRKSCLINAQYQIKGTSFRNYILDISIGGVFIETPDRFPVGETITLNFTLPSLSQPFSLSGKVAWSGPQGFGVKFETIPVQQGKAIKHFVEQVEQKD